MVTNETAADDNDSVSNFLFKGDGWLHADSDNTDMKVIKILKYKNDVCFYLGKSGLLDINLEDLRGDPGIAGPEGAEGAPVSTHSNCNSRAPICASLFNST